MKNPNDPHRTRDLLACAVHEIMWKKCRRAGAATDDNMAHDHCMLGTSGYKHTLRICNTSCSSIAAMVARARPNVTLYVWSCQYFPCVLYLTNTTTGAWDSVVDKALRY